MTLHEGHVPFTAFGFYLKIDYFKFWFLCNVIVDSYGTRTSDPLVKVKLT